MSPQLCRCHGAACDLRQLGLRLSHDAHHRGRYGGQGCGLGATTLGGNGQRRSTAGGCRWS